MNEQIDDIFNLEIARETLLEKNPNISNDEVEKIWGMCGGNPWNAVPLYEILRIADANFIGD